MSRSEDPLPLVSVITPVYNGGKYLAECIETVLRQTYPAIEYTISDNRSTDNSLEIARAYAARDPRMRVVAHTQHLSHHLASWNRAMQLASPESRYLKVVHADDWLFDECIERMVDVAEHNPTVGLVGAYRLDENRVNLDGLPPWISVINGREVARSHLLGGPLPFLFGSPTSTLLRADLVRKRRAFYFEGNIHADYEACLDVLSESDFGFVHQVLTFTRRHNEAVTAFTRRIGTYLPADLHAFQRWGPTLLSREEYDRKHVVRLLQYALFLARSAPSWRSHEFRTYHGARVREALEQVSGRQIVHGVRLQLRRSLWRQAGR